MSLTNNQLRVQVDNPIWEWCRIAPVVSSALSCSCTSDNSNFNAQFGRYIYYLISATSFWRYDTWADTYLQLTSPPTATATWASMRFSGNYGFEGRVLSAGASTITIPAYFGQVLRGYDVSIVAGTGAGQRRVITSVAESVVADTGVPTTVSTSAITDTLKSWTINQYAGYNVRISFGTGVSQVRRILYNSATVLTFIDVAKYPEDTFCNPGVPSPALVTTAGSQSIYSIESSVVTVDSAWATTPDATSRFRVSSGAILLFSSAAATPFYTVQWYDVISDTWYTKSANTLNVAAVGTDGTNERATENASVWDRGQATGGSTTTLIDTNKNWTVNGWANYWVFVFSGTAVGTISKVISNTATTLTFASTTAPDATSYYMILGFDAGTATAGGASTLTDSTQTWTANRWANYAVRILYGTGMGQVLPILSNTSTALTVVKPWATAPDNTSVYEIIGDGDKAYLMMGANAATLIYNIEDDIATYGRLNDSGAARQGAVTYGSWKPMAISTITRSGTTATVTTVNNISFPSGSTVTISGATGADAATYNISAVATITAANTFTYTMGGTPSGSATFTGHSTTTLTDSTKNWTTNQWAGYLCAMTVTTASATPPGQVLQVTSNTATTLTFSVVGTAPSNGISRYILTPRSALGALDTGQALGASQATTTLGDSTKNWTVNIWAGRKLRFLAGAGQNQEATITSNTATVLTFAVQTTAPVASSTSYAILAQPVRGAGIELNWAYGLSDTATRGKYMFSARGGAVLGFDRLDITTDTWNMMSITPQIETLTTGSMYSYDGGNRLYFTKDATQRMYYLDLLTNTLHGAGMYPYVAPTQLIGNHMEIFSTIDGLKYLWLNRAGFQECFKQLLFF